MGLFDRVSVDTAKELNLMGAERTGVDLVLEGGGMRGVFTAGVLDVMQEHGIYGFDTVWGVSAGAINAASFLSRQWGRYMRESLAFRDDRRFMSLWSFATTGNLAGADFMYHQVQDEIDPFDYEAFAKRRSRYMVVASNVVFGTPEMWTLALTDAMGTAPFVVAPSDHCCIPINMPYPTQVGADRIANAVEAKEKYGAPVIVVDFGTATNIDVVDGLGQYRGGCIAPGLMLSASALFAHAAKLASIPVQVPPAPIGDTTEHALQSGLVLGVASQAEGLVARIKAQLATECSDETGRKAALECPVVATGGLSRIINEATDVFTDIDGDLTLRGIYRIWLSHQEA